MKNKINTTISYKTKEQTVNVTIDFTHIRINWAPLTVEEKKLVQSRNNQLPASKRWKFDNTAWYKEIKSIPYGLSNMFHKHKNYLVEPIEEFVKDVLKLQDYTLEGAGSFTQEDFHNYQKNYRAAEKTRDSILYPKFNPSYTANVWYDISLNAYNKRKEFYENNHKMDTPISTPILRNASPDPIVKKENKVDIKEDIKVQETNKEKIQANGFGFFFGLLEILAPAAIQLF